MTQANRTTFFPLAGTALLLAVTAFSTPVAAADFATAEVNFTDLGYTVIPPVGWECVTVDLASAPGAQAVELSCASLALGIPMCGSVTAGVKQQTGGVGATVAVAICGTTAQAACRGTYDPVQGAKDCSVSISGSEAAKCQFFTVGTGYNSVGYCNFPII